MKMSGSASDFGLKIETKLNLDILAQTFCKSGQKFPIKYTGLVMAVILHCSVILSDLNE